MIDMWEVNHREPWGAALKGCSALRAAVLSMFRDELATCLVMKCLVMKWLKFYDNIHIPKLIRRALAMDYPIALLVGVRGSPERDISSLGAMGPGPGGFPALFA